MKDTIAHRIVSVQTEEPHGHVITVGTAGAKGKPDWHWPIAELLGALEAGESFYAVSPTTGERAEVEVVACPVPGCRAPTIRVEQSATDASAFDHLARCR